MTVTTLLSSITFGALALSGAQSSEHSSALQNAAEAVLETTDAPGIGLAMRCGSEPVHLAVAGDRISGSDTPVQPGDLWHMGSNTKAMTATLAARLVEQGVISWDTTLGEALAGVDLEIHADLVDVALAELLTHRGGVIPNPGMVTALRLAGADADRDVQADRRVYAQASVSAPGGLRGEFLYSNAGYVLAGLMMETAASMPYEALMAREVFEPLGMDSAGWGPPGVAGAADQPRGHSSGMFGGVRAREPGARADNPPAANPAGRAHMALDDLVDFLNAHRDRPTQYLSEESWERLQSPLEGVSYAMGWGVRADGTLSHAGSNTMWFAVMRVEPESGCVSVGAINEARDPAADALSRLVRDMSGLN